MTSGNASAQIDAFIAALDGWQRGTITRLRRLVHGADPDIVEEWKWGVPVYAGLEAKSSRAIDLFEGQFPDEPALKALIRAAAAANR